MADTVSPGKRSENMAKITGKNSKIELVIRHGLHARGFRYRLHRKDLPGKPDIVLPKHRAVIMINGCFWHGHDCALFRLPKTRTDFWKIKIDSTRQRDASNISGLSKLGWRIAVVWECALRDRPQEVITKLVDDLAGWLVTSGVALEMTAPNPQGNAIHDT